MTHARSQLFQEIVRRNLKQGVSDQENHQGDPIFNRSILVLQLRHNLLGWVLLTYTGSLSYGSR